MTAKCRIYTSGALRGNKSANMPCYLSYLKFSSCVLNHNAWWPVVVKLQGFGCSFASNLFVTTVSKLLLLSRVYLPNLYTNCISLRTEIGQECLQKRPALIKQYCSPAALQGHWVISCILLADPRIRAGQGKGPAEQINTRLDVQSLSILSIMPKTSVRLLAPGLEVMMLRQITRTFLTETTS